MKLVIKRATEEKKDKGLLGIGKEKLHQKFFLGIKLQGVDDSEFKLLDLYTYLANDNIRRRYTELPMIIIEDINIRGPRSVFIPDIIKGVSWECDYLSKEFVDLPYIISEKIKDTFEDIKIGKLWNDMKEEEIDINKIEK